MLKIGLLGAGRIGQVHAKSIRSNEGSALVAVSDIYSEAATSLASAAGAEVRSTEEILTATDIDALLIATSTDTHAELIEAAVASGKAVYCEKPIDLDLARAKRCQSVVEEAAAVAMVGFNRRFDPHFSRLKEQLDKGVVGAPELLALTSFDPAPPPISYVKVSGGLFRDMAIHDFDMACWLMGGAPESVSASGRCVIDPEIGASGDVDTAVTTLHFANGSMAVIKNSRRAAYGYDQRIELLGAKGLLSADNVPEDLVSTATADAVASAKPQYFFLERYMASYARAWDAFVSAVLSRSATPVRMQDGVNALTVAEAAVLSAQQGRVVGLAEVAGEA